MVGDCRIVLTEHSDGERVRRSILLIHADSERTLFAQEGFSSQECICATSYESRAYHAQR